MRTSLAVGKSLLDEVAEGKSKLYFPLFREKFAGAKFLGEAKLVDGTAVAQPKNRINCRG
jgi:hypothetical protein